MYGIYLEIRCLNSFFGLFFAFSYLVGWLEMSEPIETEAPSKGAPEGPSAGGGDKKRAPKRTPRDKACYNCGEVRFQHVVLLVFV